LNHCITETEVEEAKEFSIHSTANNGDCLFHAIRLCLFSMMKNPYTSRELRRGVAKTILNADDARAKNALQMWKAVVESAKGDAGEIDHELIHDYLFAIPLITAEADSDGIFPQHIRQQVHDNMLQSNLYWGDQYAILVLEELLNLRFVILKKNYSKKLNNFVIEKQVPVEHDLPKPFQPKWKIILALDNVHYMPIFKSITPLDPESLPYQTAFSTLPMFVERCPNKH